MADAVETLLGLLRDRYSCRAFRPDPVPGDVISRIVEAAGRAPS